MAGARLDGGSPSSSDDESVDGSGGAPLYARSPERRASSASQSQSYSLIPGSTTHSFISAMQAMTINAEEDNLHPFQKVKSSKLIPIIQSFPRFHPC